MPATAKKALASSPYQLFTRRVIVPWALQGERPAGEGLEISAGSGAMTAQLLTAFPAIRMVATDYDGDMVRVARQTVAPFGDRAIVEQADAAALPFGPAGSTSCCPPPCCTTSANGRRLSPRSCGCSGPAAA